MALPRILPSPNVDRQTLPGTTDGQSAAELTRSLFTAGDREHSVDSGRIWWITIGMNRLQPSPKRTSGQRGRQRCHRARIGRIDVSDELIENQPLLPRQRRGARNHGHHIASHDRIGQRNQLMSDPIAYVAGVVVGDVTDWFDALIAADPFGIAASEPQYGMGRPRGNRRQPVGTRTANESIQQRLSKIIGGVAGKRPVGEQAFANRSRFGFKVCALAHLTTVHHEFDSQLGGDGGCPIGVRGRFGMMAVVDVMGDNIEAALERQDHQSRRVGTARERAIGRRRRRRKRAEGEEIGVEGQSSVFFRRLPAG